MAPDETAVERRNRRDGSSVTAIETIDDLAGKTVHVRKVSTYYLSLTALNAQFRKDGKPEIKIVPVPDALEDEDLLEMLDVGLLQAIVVDDWKAKAWKQVLPNMKLHEQVVLRPKTRMGWAIRKDSPKLAAELNEFYAWYVPSKWAGRHDAHARLHDEGQGMRNAAAAEDQKRFETLIAFFKKYGGQYKFDPLMLAAQGYQESKLNQNDKSPVGAIGVMQLMPATGTELKVGDIRQAEANIHGGTKYMDVS